MANNRSVNQSVLTSAELEGALAGQQTLNDKMSSIFTAGTVVNTIIDKVMHIQYMKELEKKVLPYVVSYTKFQSLKIIEGQELVADPRADDKYINHEAQDDDLTEPTSLGSDSCQSVTKVSQKPATMLKMTRDESPQSSLRLKLQRNSQSSVRSKRKVQYAGANSGRKTVIPPEMNIKSRTTYVGEGSPHLPMENMNTDLLSTSAIAFHQKKPSNASYNNPKIVDESASEVGVASVSSHDTTAKIIRAVRSQNQTVHSQSYYQSQVVKLESKKNEEDMDEELQQKLAELRVEVMKRDIQRKFEAIHRSHTKKSVGGRINAAANPLMGGSSQNSKVTTDHEGRLIAIRSGAVAVSKPMETTVTISKAVNTQPKTSTVTIAEDQKSNAQSRIINISSHESRLNVLSKAETVDNRRGSDIGRLDESDDEPGRAYMNQSAERILGNTISSDFGGKKKKKSFANIQTVDYERSIVLDQSQMSDGVALNSHHGSRAQIGVAGTKSVKTSSMQLNAISGVNSKQNLIQSQHQSVIRPPFSSNLDGASFLSGPLENNIMTPDGKNQIRRSMQAVDYATSPNSVGANAHALMKGKNAVYASDADLHGDEQDGLMTNSLMSSVQSRQIANKQSRSMVRGRLGYGRIFTQNANDVASIIADSVQHMSQLSGSRQDIFHQLEPSMYSMMDRNQGNHERGNSISRILGKQQSEKRLHDAVRRGLSAQKEAESNFTPVKTPMNIKYTNLSVEKQHSRAEHDLGQRINSHHRPVASAISAEANSFSYLPSIQGAYRSKLQSGPSPDLLGNKRNRYGAHPVTGKSPLLMANHRRMMLDNGLGGGIKLFDKAKARSLLKQESSKQKITTIASSAAGKRVKNLQMGSLNHSNRASQPVLETKTSSNTLSQSQR